jgi:hypothetical protein
MSNCSLFKIITALKPVNLQCLAHLRSRSVASVRLSADAADSLFIDGADTGPISAGNALRRIHLDLFLFLYLSSAPATKEASFWNFPAASRTRERRDHFTATGAFHLFLLKMEIFDKSFDIPFVPPDLVKEPPRCLIRKETVEIIALPGKKGVEVYLPYLLLPQCSPGRFFLFFFHKNPHLI